ncbi:MAG: X2-like carbohydrate binding domain-containing protein [Ruminococcus sp.]
MRNKIIKIVLISLICSMLLTIFTFGGFAEETDVEEIKNYGLIEYGYTPDVPELRFDYQGPDISAYDPRISNSVVTGAYQGEAGTCWAFATKGLIEDNVYLNTGLKYNYSVDAMRYLLSNRLPLMNNDDINKGYYKRTPDGGANFSVAAAYLTIPNNPILNKNNVNWVSPNLTFDVPYTGLDIKDDGKNNEGFDSNNYWPENLNTSYGNAYASETKYINKEKVKESVLKYGGVFTGVAYIMNLYYNYSTSSYYENHYGFCTHAIEIVGWDDNYPKENFNSNCQPENDGAWLAKDSLAWTNGGNGYTWISYDTYSLNYIYNYFTVISDTDKLSKNEKVLAYDFMPPENKNSVYNVSSPADAVYMANVYDVSDLADEYGEINKVMFYSGDIGSSYKIYIAPVNSDGTLPTVSQMGSYLCTGTIDSEGYRTAYLSEPYEIPENLDKLAVIVKFYTDSDYITLYKEKKYDSMDGEYSVWVKPGESYVYYNNQWTDISYGEDMNTYGNFCIRPTLVRRTPITEDSTLSANEVKYTGEPVSVNINLNGNLLYSIEKNGSTILKEDTDFTRSGNTVTLKKSFLDSLSTTSATNVVFNFTDGASQTLRILPKAELQSATISGKYAIGQTLTATAISTDGEVSDSDVNYQWQYSADGNSWTNILGAMSKTYTLTNNQFLKYVRVKVTAKRTGDLIYPKTIYSESTPIKIILYGDVNLNGEVTVNDATMLNDYIAEITTEPFSAEQIYAADVNGSGKLEIMDATDIQFYAAGLIDKFEVEK